MGFYPKQQCVQQVIDADSLLKIVTKIVDDIPNICLSKFKLCGGFEAPSSQPPPSPLYFPEFRTNDIPEEDVKKSLKMEMEPKLRQKKLVNVGQQPKTKAMDTV